MKPAATSLDNTDFSVRKFPFENQLTDRNVSRYNSVLKINFRIRPLGPKISTLDALATQFHEKSGLTAVRVASNKSQFRFGS